MAPSSVFAGVIFHDETLIYNTTRKKIVDEDVITQEGSSNSQMYSSGESERMVLLRTAWITDSQKLCKIKTRTNNRDGIY